VPQFDAENPIHTYLAALSQQAHQLAAAGDEGLAAVEAQVDDPVVPLSSSPSQGQLDLGGSPTAACIRMVI